MRRYSDPDQMDLLLATSGDKITASIAINMDRRKHESNLRILHVDKSRNADQSYVIYMNGKGEFINVQ